MPFLEILTRHYTARPNFLAANRDSLRRQIDDDYLHTLLVDEQGRGVEWANRNLGQYAPKLLGEWIWVLDDDDLCVCDTLVTDLRRIVANHDPLLIYVRGRLGDVVYPPDAHWGKAPALAQIGMSNFIVRRDVWQAFAHAFPKKLCADFHFIRAVHGNIDPQRIYWHDKVVMATQRVASRGRGE